MSKKLEKLRASQAKDKERLETIRARLKAREEVIRAEEKTEILGIVEEIGMTPEQLTEHFADLLAQGKRSKKKENSANETV